MEKLFYYTGATIWIIIALFIAFIIIAFIWKWFQKTIVWGWIDVQLSKIRYAGKFECTQDGLDFLKSRVEHLKENKRRVFEQKFLEDLISRAVIKKQETVFD